MPGGRSGHQQLQRKTDSLIQKVQRNHQQKKSDGKEKQAEDSASAERQRQTMKQDHEGEDNDTWLHGFHAEVIDRHCHSDQHDSPWIGVVHEFPDSVPQCRHLPEQEKGREPKRIRRQRIRDQVGSYQNNHGDCQRHPIGIPISMLVGGVAGEIPPKEENRDQGNQRPVRVIGDMTPMAGEPDVAIQLGSVLRLNSLHKIRVVDQTGQNHPKGNLHPVDSTGGKSDRRNRSPVTHSDLIFEGKLVKILSSLRPPGILVKPARLLSCGLSATIPQ